MTNDYCKLVSGIILSSIWREDDRTRILWITMLALKDRNQNVFAAIPGLAAVANIPIKSCRASLIKLMSPESDSRSKEHEGRRILQIEGGWWIVNGEKYRNFLSKHERNEYQRKLMAERRKKRDPKLLAPVSRMLAVLGQTETETVQGAPVPSSTAAVLSKGECKGGAGGEVASLLKKTPTLEEVQLAVAKTGLPESDAVWFWNHCQSNGWTNGGKPIKSWPHCIGAWKAAGYFPSQKSSPGTNSPPKKSYFDKKLEAIDREYK